MSLLTEPEARALIATGLSSAELQDVIDREGSWLAGRIGALSGTRAQTFWVRATDLDDPLLLRRPTASASVVDGGVALDPSVVRLLGDGTVIEKATGPWIGPSVVATYTPNDEGGIKTVLVDLVRLTVTASPFVSEDTDGYSYQRGGADATRSVASARRSLARSLMPHLGPTSVRLGSGAWSGRIGEAVST